MEDTPLFFRAALLGDIAYIDAPLVRYRLDGLSGVPQESRGWRHLYGFRIKRKEWWLLSHRSFLRDLARMETPRKTEMEALCRQRIEETEFELRLVRGTRLSRLTSLPRAAWLSLSRRKRVFLVDNLKFLFEEIYMSYLDRRRGGLRRLRRPEPGTAPAPHERFRPRIGVVLPEFGVSSHVWAIRQALAFEEIEPILFAWRWAPDCEPIPERLERRLFRSPSRRRSRS